MQRGDDDSYHCTSSFSVAWAGAGTRQKTAVAANASEECPENAADPESVRYW